MLVVSNWIFALIPLVLSNPVNLGNFSYPIPSNTDFISEIPPTAPVDEVVYSRELISLEAYEILSGLFLRTILNDVGSELITVYLPV